MQYTSENILVRPAAHADDPDLILSITPAVAGWDYISFQVRRLANGRSWSFASGENELAIVLLSGDISVATNRGVWDGMARQDVWTSAATALYLPRHTEFAFIREARKT